MAMLRFSTVVPLALRAISSPRISGCLSVTKAAALPPPIVSDRHFSTADSSKSNSKSITRKLCGIIKSEIKNYDLALAKSMEVPDKLPFTIEDDPSYCHIMLKRDFGDEKVEITVNPIYEEKEKEKEVASDEGTDTTSDSTDSDSDDSSNEKEEEKEKDESSGVDVPAVVPIPPPPQSVSINVSLIKEGKGTIDISAYVSADEIVVHKIAFTEPNQFYPALRYNVRDDGGLLDYLLVKFIEIRGVEKDNVGFLYNYMDGKRRRWRTERPSSSDFRNLKKFLEEW